MIDAASHLSSGVLGALGFAVLSRRADGLFDVLRPAPPWFSDTFGDDNADPFDAAAASDFLGAFLADADDWWLEHDAGVLGSGVFSEHSGNGSARTLEAKALTVDGRAVLLLGPPAFSYETSSAWLGLVRQSEMAAERERRRVMEREVLLHTIVHDLSNPLAGIRGSLRLMLDTPGLSDETAELGEIAARSAERMRTMIGSILHTFRDEVAPLLPTTNGEVADAASAARFVLECFQARAEIGDVNLRLDLARDMLPVIAEQPRLERVLLNLVDNAFRHVSPGGSIVLRGEHDGAHVLLSVSDDGAGVDPDAVPHLFESFEQRGGVPGRIGLGLYSCRIAAEGWGGEIAYESTQPVERHLCSASYPHPRRPNPMPRLRIFLVDDDPDYARLLALRLEREQSLDVETTTLASGEALLEALAAGGEPDLVFLDVVMPGIGGLEALRRALSRRPELSVVVLSAQINVRVALEAIELGADDYLVKGEDDLSRVGAMVRRAAERRSMQEELVGLRARLGEPVATPRLIGESEAMAGVYRLISKAVRGDIATAILGESGTGKELVAQAIHDGSARRNGAFVVLNCAAIPRELMESEIFGHEKGSFTGAHARREGVFEQADGGTLFLDEIGELELGLQAKLLRVLQDGQVRRVGGNDVFYVDVRVLSATHRDVPGMVREGTFREDLYYRLLQFPIRLPALRERGGDILLLAEHFLRRAGAKHSAKHSDIAARGLSASAKRALVRYPWPGNVRELRSVIERAVLIADGEHIEPADLMLDASNSATNAANQAAASVTDAIVPIETLKQIALEHAWDLCEGRADEVAERLGITRSTVYRLRKRFGFDA